MNLFKSITLSIIYVLSIGQANANTSDIANVEPEITVSLSGCFNSHPISVSYTNHHSEPLISIDFDLRFFVRGYSTILASDTLVLDRIVEPGETYSACFTIDDEHLLKLSETVDEEGFRSIFIQYSNNHRTSSVVGADAALGIRDLSQFEQQFAVGVELNSFGHGRPY